MIIGINGYARSGKDTIADYLVRRHGFRKVAYADKLREALYALNPVVQVSNVNHGGEWYHIDTVEVHHLQDIIDEYGWDGYKETPYGLEIRRLIQRMGTEVGRNVLGEDIWVDATFADIKQGENVVVSDMRFDNEYRAVQQVGGRLWRVRRPGVDKVNAHPSETSLDNYQFDVVLSNNGSEQELYGIVERAYDYAFSYDGTVLMFANGIEVD